MDSSARRKTWGRDQEEKWSLGGSLAFAIRRTERDLDRGSRRDRKESKIGMGGTFGKKKVFSLRGDEVRRELESSEKRKGRA